MGDVRILLDKKVVDRLWPDMKDSECLERKPIRSVEVELGILGDSVCLEPIRVLHTNGDSTDLSERMRKKYMCLIVGAGWEE